MASKLGGVRVIITSNDDISSQQNDFGSFIDTIGTGGYYLAEMGIVERLAKADGGGIGSRSNRSNFVLRVSTTTAAPKYSVVLFIISGGNDNAVSDFPVHAIRHGDESGTSKGCGA